VDEATEVNSVSIGKDHFDIIEVKQVSEDGDL
jgi:hypothetical protein